MQDLELQAIEKCLSTQRLGKYGHDRQLAIEIYEWNIALSESLYPLLHVIEVALRNKLHIEISQKIGDNTWLVNRNKQITLRLHNHWLQKLDHNISDLSKKNGSPPIL